MVFSETFRRRMDQSGYTLRTHIAVIAYRSNLSKGQLMMMGTGSVLDTHSRVFGWPRGLYAPKHKAPARTYILNAGHITIYLSIYI